MSSKRNINIINVRIVARVLVVSVMLAAIFFYFTLSSRRVTPILMYHSLCDKEGDSLCVTPGNFRKQMEFLRKSGYSVISLNELAESIKRGRRYIPKTVVITFDDGFENNYARAFPVLNKYGMPATIFLITGYVDKKEGYLKWDQVILMQKNGISFGAHTRTNEYLPAVDGKELLLEEIAGSKSDIEARTGGKVDFFCYPLGGFTEDIKKIVKDAGYKGACTTNRGLDRLNRDLYELKRVKVTNSDTNKPFHFRAKVSGYYNAFRSLKKGD